MKIDIFESEFRSGKHICFKDLDYVDDFDVIAKIIDENIEVQLIDNIDGIWSRYRTYKLDNIEFNLMYHEDIGNCLRLPLKRDHRYDKKGYELLRNIGKQIVDIINAKTE